MANDLATGGAINAIIPQTLGDVQRLAKMIVASGLAPYSLIGSKQGEDAIAAVSIVILSGSELGLPPMVSLRSFTVIGGKPALYGDGLINVVRRSGKAKLIDTGFDEARVVGFCEAVRADTGERKRVEFSIDDAKRAGLWDERKEVKRKSKNGSEYMAPNDSPWFKYPKRMLEWRAAGYCLRGLFADVLGGIQDEFEAREIASREMVDITPPRQNIPQDTSGPPEPPEPPEIGPPEPDEAPTISDDQWDFSGFLHELEDGLRSAKTPIELEEIWNDFDAPATLESYGHSDLVETAYKIKNRNKERFR